MREQTRQCGDGLLARISLACRCAKAGAALLEAAGVGKEKDAGVVAIGPKVDAFVEAAKQHRIWTREPRVRTVP